MVVFVPSVANTESGILLQIKRLGNGKESDRWNNNCFVDRFKQRNNATCTFYNFPVAHFGCAFGCCYHANG